MKNIDETGCPPGFLNLTPPAAAGRIVTLCAQTIHLHSPGYFKRSGQQESFEGVFYWFNHEDDLKNSILNGWFPMLRAPRNAEFHADATRLESYLLHSGKIADIFHELPEHLFDSSSFTWCGNIISLLSGEQSFEKQFRKEFREWIRMIEPLSPYAKDDDRLLAGIHTLPATGEPADNPTQPAQPALSSEILDHLNRYFSSPVRMPVVLGEDQVILNH